MRHSPRPRLHLALALTLPACTGEPDPAHTSTGEPPPASTSSASSTSTATPGDPTTGELATATTDAGATTEVSTAAATGTSVPDLGDHLPSRCSETARSIVCPKTTVELGPWQRDVHFQVPLGEPPPAGWPAVLMFQGSFFSAEITWNAAPELPFGAYWQTLVVKRLLDHGYAVITPEAKLGGGTFWDTNVPPWSLNWESSEDHALMLEIFAQIDASPSAARRRATETPTRAVAAAVLSEVPGLLATLSGSDAECLRARYVGQVSHALNHAGEIDQAEALHRQLPDLATTDPFARSRRANGIAYGRFRHGDMAAALEQARLAARYAGDAGHVRLRAMALLMVARVAPRTAEGAEARARARAIALALADATLLNRCDASERDARRG